MVPHEKYKVPRLRVTNFLYTYNHFSYMTIHNLLASCFILVQAILSLNYVDVKQDRV